VFYHYWFLVRSPSRYAIETDRWVRTHCVREPVIVAPVHIGISWPGRVAVSGTYVRTTRLRDVIERLPSPRPLVCIVPNEHAMLFPEDVYYLRVRAALLKTIGYFCVYTIS
jgi:hypothetical protein